MDDLAFVSPRFPPYVGGIETHVSEIAGRAAARFDRVSVITTDPSGQLPSTELLDNGLSVRRVRAFAPNGNYHFPALPRFLKCLDESHPKIMHLHSIHDIPCVVAELFETESSIVFTPHFHGTTSSTLGRIFFGAYRQLLRKLVKRAARIICVSHIEADLMKEVFPLSAAKLAVIPNGVDFNLTSKYSWSEPEESRILYVGRLEPYKNVDKILRAFAFLRTKNSLLKLTIVGTGSMKNELLALAASLKLGKSVEWLEGVQRSRIYRLYSSSTAVVLPSDLEAYGIVAAEAISIGAPTIVANSSGLSEFVKAGLALPIEPPVTEQKLVSRILQILDNPQGFSFKEKSPRLIPSWDEVAAKTFALYESL